MKHTSESNLNGYQNMRDHQKAERRKRRVRHDKRILIIAMILIALLVVVTRHGFAQEIEKDALTKEVSTSAIEVKKEKPLKKEKVKETAPKAVKKQAVTKKEEASIYNPEIPMPKEHQEYLYELCQEQGLNYKKTLAVIQHESVFNPNAVNETNDYGYFQVNLVNHKTLAKKLGTENSPLNPYVNMVWGTHMLSELYADYQAQGYQGQGLDDAVWSSYNKGKAGFQKYGHATAYIHKMKASIQDINAVF